jgi:hypothetical protein
MSAMPTDFVILASFLLPASYYLTAICWYRTSFSFLSPPFSDHRCTSRYGDLVNTDAPVPELGNIQPVLIVNGKLHRPYEIVGL